MSELVAGSIVVDLQALNQGFNKGMGAAIDSVEKLDKTAKNLSDKTLNGLGNVAKSVGNTVKTGLMFGLTALAGAVSAAGVSSVRSAADMQTMGVALETALGSVEAATEAQAQITKFAAKTPYELNEVMGAFIKLKNMGLDPGEKALTAYGDTASAMGKSLNDMVEAVADAATGEFERLKEFGIRSSKEGDKVKFTFKGVTTTVKMNSDEIQKYLIGLGETNFAGGMDKQSKTLSGRFSTLKNTIGLALGTLAQKTGVVEALGKAMDTLSTYINEIDLDKLIQDVTNLAKEIETNLKTGLDWVIKNKDLVISVLAGLGAALITLVVPAVIAWGKATWNAAAATIVATWPLLAIAAAIGLLVGALVWLYFNWDTVTKFLTDTWNYAKDQITAVANQFWGMLVGKFNEGKNWVVGIWESIVNSLKAAWDWVVNIIQVVASALFLTIYAIFTGDGELLKQVWGKIWEWVWDKIVSISIWIAGKVVEMWSWVSGTFKTGVDNASKFFSELPKKISDGWNSILDTAKNLGNQIKETATQKFKELTENVTGFVDTIKNIDYMQIGKDMIQGLINGVKNMAGSLAGAVGDTVNGAVNSAKEKLGIKSPSRVFMEIGKYTGEGMAIGINKSERDVEQASLSLASATINAGNVTGLINSNADSIGTSNISTNTNFGGININIDNGIKSEKDARDAAYLLKKAIEDIVLRPKGI